MVLLVSSRTSLIISTMPTTAQLKKAVIISEKLDALEAELAALLGGSTASAKRGRPPGKPVKKNGMSDEGRQRIAEAQKKRWAAKKKADGKK
jgi:hypothetical protein